MKVFRVPKVADNSLQANLVLNLLQIGHTASTKLASMLPLQGRAVHFCLLSVLSEVEVPGDPTQAGILFWRSQTNQHALQED